MSKLIQTLKNIHTWLKGKMENKKLHNKHVNFHLASDGDYPGLTPYIVSGREGNML